MWAESILEKRVVCFSLERVWEMASQPYSRFQFITDWASKCTAFGLALAFKRQSRTGTGWSGGSKRGFDLFVALGPEKLQRKWKNCAATEPFRGFLDAGMGGF